jgi:hypothetical protein
MEKLFLVSTWPKFWRIVLDEKLGSTLPAPGAVSGVLSVNHWKAT